MKKDGPNKGRQFFKCPKQPQPCNFFQWADEASPQRGSGAGPSSSTSTNFSNARQYDGNAGQAAAGGAFVFLNLIRNTLITMVLMFLFQAEHVENVAHANKRDILGTSVPAYRD